MRPDSLPAAWFGAVLDSAALQDVAGQGLDEEIYREFLINRELSGSMGAPERFYRSGLGWEMWTELRDGAPVQDPSAPWDHLPTEAPLLLNSISLLPYDPVWAPLATGVSGILYLESMSAETGLPSGFRLTTGPYGTTTEEAWIERPFIKGSRLAFLYSDSRSDGRVFIGPHRGQNLLFRLNRPIGRSRHRLEWAQNSSEVWWIGNRKLRWDTNELRAKSAFALGHHGDVEARFQRSVRQFLWYDYEGRTRRREEIYDASFFWRRAGLGGRLEGSGRGIVSHRRWDIPAASTRTTEDVGIAFAMGWRGGPESSRIRLSTGLEVRRYDQTWVEPVGSMGYRGRFGDWIVQSDLWSAVQVPMVPTESNAYSEILLRGAPSDWMGRGRELERVHHGEIGWGYAGRGAGHGELANSNPIIEIATFFEDHYKPWPILFVSTESLENLDPAMGDWDRLALEGRLHLGLPWNFQLSGRVTRILSPADPLERFWLPAWTSLITLGWRAPLFGGDLLLDTRITWIGRDKWNTPYGEVPWDDILEGEVRGRIGQASWFLLFKNLEDDYRESSSYVEGWMSRPLQSASAGITWHFDN
ncbi:MAG: hypothetical protein KJ970_10955 [Candidatus Eisenbacteria bacterium]|uniref:Uncharacterized protein n=1 Tax=Eiseniibacteriota bacterium TaxID=2212470 RepID=A0A948W6F1_UNCEI|nr:hypothetical protein [Candidatus Eisenbacteria bacterium]